MCVECCHEGNLSIWHRTDAVLRHVLVVHFYWELLVDVLVTQCLWQPQHRGHINIHLPNDPEHSLTGLCFNWVEIAAVVAVQTHSESGAQGDSNISVALR